MSRHDRLTTLISRFTLEVHPAPPEAATLVVLEDAQGRPCKALFQPRAAGFELGAARAVVAARVDWGGISNPLVSALPDRIEVDLTCDEETMALAMLMLVGRLEIFPMVLMLIAPYRGIRRVAPRGPLRLLLDRRRATDA